MPNTRERIIRAIRGRPRAEIEQPRGAIAEAPRHAEVPDVIKEAQRRWRTQQYRARRPPIRIGGKVLGASDAKASVERSPGVRHSRGA